MGKKRIMWPCNYHHKYILNFLFMQILWREYLVISCSSCRDIKLVNLVTLDISTAFSDDQPLGKVCKGWHKLYVEVPSGYLELDCSSTKFTKIRQIKSGKGGYTYLRDLWHIPSPHNMIMVFKILHGNSLPGGAIHTTYLGELSKTIWHLCDKHVDGKSITPRSVVYSSRHNVLLVVDKINQTVWVLNPSTGNVLQNIDVPELDHHDKDNVKGYLRGSQLVIVSDSKIHYFSIA